MSGHFNFSLHVPLIFSTLLLLLYAYRIYIYIHIYVITRFPVSNSFLYRTEYVSVKDISARWAWTFFFFWKILCYDMWLPFNEPQTLKTWKSWVLAGSYNQECRKGMFQSICIQDWPYTIPIHMLPSNLDPGSSNLRSLPNLIIRYYDIIKFFIKLVVMLGETSHREVFHLYRSFPC